MDLPDTWRAIEERRQFKKKALDSKLPSHKERAVAQYRDGVEWIVCACRMPFNAITRTALRWIPRSKSKMRRPRETWRRTVEKDLDIRGLSFDMDIRASADQARWRTLAVVSRARWRREDESVLSLHLSSCISHIQVNLRLIQMPTSIQRH